MPRDHGVNAEIQTSDTNRDANSCRTKLPESCGVGSERLGGTNSRSACLGERHVRRERCPKGVTNRALEAALRPFARPGAIQAGQSRVSAVQLAQLVGLWRRSAGGFWVSFYGS